MLVTLSLTLPGEATSVRVARRMLADTLNVLGVAQDAAFDLCVALSEACTNVVEHARADAGYEVVVEVDDESCRLTVTDNGRGFEGRAFEPTPDAGVAGTEDATDWGRGLNLIRMLTDRFGISSGPGEGVIVFLEKRFRPPPAAGSPTT